MPENVMAYLDYNATAPLTVQAADAMSAWLAGRAANPASQHRWGRDAWAAVDDARHTVAQLLAVEPSSIVFTSGGTESNNLALWGAFDLPPKGHLVVSSTEHPAVLEPAAALEATGVAVTRLGVDKGGLVDLDGLAGAIRPETRLISIMAANHEVGTLQPVQEIARLARARGVLFHSDAVQAAPWLDLTPLAAGADLITLSSHKLGGPVGVGALYVRPGLHLEPHVRGGLQQAGRRGGTEPAALIQGFAAACARVARLRPTAVPRVQALRNTFEETVLGRVPDAHRTGAAEPRLPNTSHLCFRSCDGNALVARLDLKGVAASSGAACSSGVPGPSPVLDAMGISANLRGGALRISLGYESTGEEINRAAELVCESVEVLRRAGVEAGI
jgi:cysteine desulfurase